MTKGSSPKGQGNGDALDANLWNSGSAQLKQEACVEIDDYAAPKAFSLILGEAFSLVIVQKGGVTFFPL